MEFAYHVVRPCHPFGLELGTVPDLQGAAAPPGEELGDFLPCQLVLLLQLDEQCVVLERELGFGSRRWTGLILEAGLAGARDARGGTRRACHAARALDFVVR